jgi:aspartyl-tRNA(Asn)/glutamyl-tRNA(Gln) amidotransferase subunit B
VSDADMEKGQMRCDVQRLGPPARQAEFGTKIEIKNMNRSAGCGARWRTRSRGRSTWSPRRHDRAGDAALGRRQGRRRFAMRTKEKAHDYRYFPDPDLMPVRTAISWTRCGAGCRSCPAQKRERFVRSTA